VTIPYPPGSQSPDALTPALPTEQPGCAVLPTGPSQQVADAYSAYRANPGTATYGAVVQAFKQLLAQAGAKTPAAALIKANPALSDLGARAVDAGAGRVWIFTRALDTHQIVLQWADVKPIVTYVGRRHRTKKVSYATTWRVGSMSLPPTVALNEARVVGSSEGTHSLILVGVDKGSSLWLRRYQQSNGGWVEAPGQFDSIPAFLMNDVSGKVAFRGPDLIFTVGRVVSAKEEGSPSNLPEAPSSTYRFWLHLGENGYVLMPHLPDEQQFYTVRQFLEAIANGRTDVARSLLSDQRLLSIPKYVGLKGPNNAFRVAQMASPPSGAPRFRLITGGKDDLIFEVAKIKGSPVIRAIFIASPDPFLQEIARQLPTYDKVAPQPPPAEQLSVDKH
jgi:hypothetical protein